MRLSRQLKAEQAQCPTTVEERRAALGFAGSPQPAPSYCSQPSSQFRLGAQTLRLQQVPQRTVAQTEM